MIRSSETKEAARDALVAELRAKIDVLMRDHEAPTKMSAEAVRQYARNEIEALTRRHDECMARLKPQAEAATNKRDELRKQLEEAEREVSVLGDEIFLLKEQFGRRRAELQHIASAGERWLIENGHVK
jgi:hypothetical protein